MNFRPLLCLLLLAASAIPGSRLHSQTLVASGGPTIVYEISFDSSSSDSINYSPYNSGYYVAPAAGGTGSLLLTKSSGGTNNLYVFANFGELFVALDGSQRKAVLTCTSTSDISTTAFFAMGDAQDTLQSNSGAFSGQIYYAASLKGYSISADPQADQLFQGAAGVDQGVAGSSVISVTYDDADTNTATEGSLSVASTVTAIQARLTSQGFVLATQNTPTSGTGTGTILTPATSSVGAGDVLVYQLHFSKTGDSVNYRQPLGGYYISYAATTDPGTLILDSKLNGKDVYQEYPGFGSLFVATSDQGRKGVLYAAATGTVSRTTFFGLGDAYKAMQINTPAASGTVYFASSLYGYAISADSAQDLPFDGASRDFGSAGTCILTATYDEARSSEANSKGRTVATEVTALEARLKSTGFSPFQ